MLKNKGKFNDDVDTLVRMLDELLEEKKAILKSLQDESSANCSVRAEPKNRIKELIGGRMRNMRENRLKEVEELVEAIKDELNKLTSQVDAIPPKAASFLKSNGRRMQEENSGLGANVLQTKKRGAVAPVKQPRSKESENELVISLQAVQRILTCAGVDDRYFSR